MQRRLWALLGITSMVSACDIETRVPAVDTGVDRAEVSDGDARKVYTIVPGRGIGPVQLGGRYGHLVDAYGEPDNLIEYNRVYFATWIQLGVEVVIASEGDQPEPESLVISVGTRLPTGFDGPVVPGMSKEDADDVLGPCEHVIDEQHCYHPAGVYLGYSDGMVKTIAIHRPYTQRIEPPAMQPSLASGGVR